MRFQFQFLGEIPSELQTEKIDNAELKGKLKSVEREKTIRNICLVAGTAVASFGIDQVKSQNNTVGFTLIFIGVCLTLVGLFSIGGKESK